MAVQQPAVAATEQDEQDGSAVAQVPAFGQIAAQQQQEQQDVAAVAQQLQQRELGLGVVCKGGACGCSSASTPRAPAAPQQCGMPRSFPHLMLQWRSRPQHWLLIVRRRRQAKAAAASCGSLRKRHFWPADAGAL